MANQQRRSILCPNCRKLISVDEARCPYCGTGKPGSWWKNNYWTQGLRNTDQLIKAIIFVNLGIYLVSLLLDPLSSRFSLNPFSFLSPGNRSLFVLGATGTIPINQFGRWWTLVSANYLHGSILHILFNMVAFRQLSPLVLQEYGAYRMLSIYTMGGIFGFLVSYLAGVPLTIGASASVCSLIGATLYYGKSRGGTYGQSIYRQIGGWTLGIFIFGFLVPGINNWGHGGGILGGIVLGALLGYHERRREGVFHKILAGACVALTVVILAWAILSGISYRVLGLS
ncbi:MAG: rhomboid family intramembrane serine protease [Desulfobacteraceae bacterium]|jgi:rhomboid protease GluP